MKKNIPSKSKLPYIPRIIVKMNTGTRIILSKKDKANTRRELNRQTRNEW